MLSARKLPSVLRTSGASTRPSTPSVTSISPLFSGVTLGYQRSSAMSGPRSHPLVSSSKVYEFGRPSSAAFLFPPAVKSVPSIRWARPLQKMLKPVSIASTCEPLVGSQTVARVKLWSSTPIASALES